MPPTPIFCPAGVKTEVLWSAFVLIQYKGVFSHNGVQIQWERNSTLIPWHTAGMHNTQSRSAL